MTSLHVLKAILVRWIFNEAPNYLLSNLTQIDESASGLFGKKAHFLMIGCSAAVLLSNDTLSISNTKSFERMCFGEIFEKSKLPRVQKIAWMNEEKKEIPPTGIRNLLSTTDVRSCIGNSSLSIAQQCNDGKSKVLFFLDKVHLNWMSLVLTCRNRISLKPTTPGTKKLTRIQDRSDTRVRFEPKVHRRLGGCFNTLT